MTPEQIELVAASLIDLRDSDDAARRFHERLFDLAPETRPLFPDDLQKQGARFFAMLTELVSSLDELPEFALRTRSLGARHRGYGVRANHFPLVRVALLHALTAALGERLSHEQLLAWGTAYDLMAEVMQQGASAAADVPTLSSRRHP